MDYREHSRDYQFEPPNRSTPTEARPGSTQKLQIMAERYRSGQPLHHPNDETLVALSVRKTMSVFLAWARDNEREPHSSVPAVLKPIG